jgi:Flp pilus assembly pilin Flp
MFCAKAKKDKIMLNGFQKFVRDEDGAVTVDWVVLCAGIVAMAVAIFTSMSDGTMVLTDAVANFMKGWTF